VCGLERQGGCDEDMRGEETAWEGCGIQRMEDEDARIAAGSSWTDAGQRAAEQSRVESKSRR